jgi:hypothetical protein
MYVAADHTWSLGIHDFTRAPCVNEIVWVKGKHYIVKEVGHFANVPNDSFNPHAMVLVGPPASR